MAEQQTRTSVAYLIAGLVALAFAVIGLAWYFWPAASSRGYGVELPNNDQMAFAYIKGMEDVIAAVLIGTFLVRRDRTGTMLVLIAVTIVPIGDLLALSWAGASIDVLPLALNAVLLTALLTSLFLLGFGGTADERPRPETLPWRKRPIVPEWLPRSRGKVTVLIAAAIMFAVIAFGFTFWWLIGPVSLSSSFGAELGGTRLAYAYIKGFEDAFISLAVIMFLVRRRRAELMIVIAISLLIVVGDQLAQTLAGFFIPQIFIAHVAYLLVAGGALAALRPGPGPTDRV
jgi:hypothetical protein